MAETKANINQLFKKGNATELKVPDYNTGKAKDDMKALNSVREEARKSADVDLSKLKNTFFKI